MKGRSAVLLQHRFSLSTDEGGLLWNSFVGLWEEDSTQVEGSHEPPETCKKDSTQIAQNAPSFHQRRRSWHVLLFHAKHTRKICMCVAAPALDETNSKRNAHVAQSSQNAKTQHTTAQMHWNARRKIAQGSTGFLQNTTAKGKQVFPLWFYLKAKHLPSQMSLAHGSNYGVCPAISTQ